MKKNTDNKKNFNILKKLTLWVGIILMFIGYINMKLSVAASGAILLEVRFLVINFIAIKHASDAAEAMKSKKIYKCPVCGEHLNNGYCSLCGYRFKK